MKLMQQQISDRTVKTMIIRDQRQYSRSIRIVTFREIAVDEISAEALIGEEEEKINCWMAKELWSIFPLFKDAGVPLAV